MSPVSNSSFVIFWVSITTTLSRLCLHGQHHRDYEIYYIRDMKTLADRLSWARTQKGMTQGTLAKLADVTQSTIGNLESGTRLSARRIASIAEALGVNVLWLSEGKGEPYLLSGNAENFPGARKVSPTDEVSGSSVQIRKVELKLSAGITGYQTEPDRRDGGLWDLPRRWIQKEGLNAEQLLAIDVRGESMEPTLYEGDVVIINIADTNPVNGLVYAINYEGEAVIKRLVREGGQWYLVSDNPSPRFPKRMCHGSEWSIVGRVVRREGAL